MKNRSEKNEMKLTDQFMVPVQSVKKLSICWNRQRIT